MVKDHLILRAPLLIACAQEFNITLKHTQALDLLASMVGRRDWREVCAFEALLVGERPTLQGYQRLSQRIHKKHGIVIDVDALIRQLEEYADPDPAVIWPDGPRSGVYFTESAEDEKRAIELYSELAGMPYYYSADRDSSPTDDGINIGTNGLHSEGLRKLPGGTLVVVRIEEPSEYTWTEESSWALRTACALALTAGHRVIVRMDTHSTGQTIREAAILTASDPNVEADDDGSPHRTAFRGILTPKGFKEMPLIEMWRLMSPAARPSRRQLISPTFHLPKSATEALHTVGQRKAMGHVFVGLDLHRRTQGKNAPETTERMDYSNRALEAVLHAIDPTRPCALVTESWRHTLHKPERPGLEDLPVFPSVHSAIDAGYDLVVVMKPCSPRKGMLAFRNHCLLVSYHWGSLAGHTASQSLTSCDGKGYPLDAIAAVVALPLSLADDEGKIPMADVYLANGKTGAFLDNGKIGIHVHEHRSADVFEQVKDYLAKQGMQYQPQIQTYEGYPPHVRDLLPDPAEVRA